MIFPQIPHSGLLRWPWPILQRRSWKISRMKTVQTGNERFALKDGDILLGYVTKTYSGWTVENAACTYRTKGSYPDKDMAADILRGKVELRREDKWDPR